MFALLSSLLLMLLAVAPAALLRRVAADLGARRRAEREHREREDQARRVPALVAEHVDAGIERLRHLYLTGVVTRTGRPSELALLPVSHPVVRHLFDGGRHRRLFHHERARTDGRWQRPTWVPELDALVAEAERTWTEHEGSPPGASLRAELRAVVELQYAAVDEVLEKVRGQERVDESRRREQESRREEAARLREEEARRREEAATRRREEAAAREAAAREAERARRDRHVDDDDTDDDTDDDEYDYRAAWIQGMYGPYPPRGPDDPRAYAGFD